MQINRVIMATLLMILVMVGLYFIDKVGNDSVEVNESCICDSSYIKPNLHFLHAPVAIKEITIEGKIIYPTDLINESDSFMVGRKDIRIKLIDGIIINDSVCLEIDCLNYDLVIDNSFLMKFEPSTYD